MPITRDQARRLLTQSEMGLFGDSRNPALRAHSEKALVSRVERARKLRDKSRDLLQRQKLRSRDRTGSKLGISGAANIRTGKKTEVLEDILQRFEGRLNEIQTAGKPPAAARGKAKSPVAAGNAAVKKARSPRKTTGGALAKKAITPKRALQNTRALLDAKQQRTRQPPAYLAIDSHAETEQSKPGFQSAAAKSKARESHEAEIRMDPIHGSISTHDRKNQGKRDGR